MSALGDYIHLNASNYIKYGISHRGEVRKPDMGQVLSQQRAINRQRIQSLPTLKQDGVLKELKRRIQQNFGPEKANATQQIIQHGETKLAKDIKDYILANVTGAPENKVAAALKNFDVTNNSPNLDAAMKHRDNLLRVINYYNKHPNDSSPDTIAKHLNNFFRTLGFAIPKGQWLVNPEEIKSQKAHIGDAIRQVVMADCFAQAHKATVHGKMGERIVAMCDDMIEQGAVKNLNQAIESAIVGGQGSSFSIGKSFIQPSVAQVYQEKYKQNLYRVSKTQDKVDVQISVQGTPINASVKAYTPKSNKINAHLQDVSLLTSLASTGGNFANHWLNLHCHGLPSASLDEQLEQSIRYEALISGNLLKHGTKRADTFIAIDTINGRVYATSTREIMEKQAPGTNFILNPMVQAIEIGGNVRQNTWEQRIANIINSIHQVKLKASLVVSLRPVE